MSFQWHTDDEQSWETPAAGAHPAVPRRLRIFLILVAIVVAVGGYRVLTLRAAAVRDWAREDVRDAHRLLEQTAASGVGELLGKLVAGPQRARQPVLATRSLYQPPFVDLVDQAVPGRPRARLEPDLQSATVTQIVSYTLSGQREPIRETIQLRRAFQYRRVGERWQLAPLPSESSCGWCPT